MYWQLPTICSLVSALIRNVDKFSQCLYYVYVLPMQASWSTPVPAQHWWQDILKVKDDILAAAM